MTWIDNLNDVLVSHIYSGLTNLYNNVLTRTIRNGRDKILLAFQLSLERIPVLPQTKIREDYSNLVSKMHNNGKDVQWLHTLIEKSILFYAKDTLKTEGMENNTITLKQLNADTSSERFIHRVYINSARFFWMHPNLFYHKYDSIIKQENQSTVLSEIKSAILKTIRESIDLNNIFSKENYEKPKMNNISVNDQFDVQKSLLDSNSEDEEEIDSSLTRMNLSRFSNTLQSPMIYSNTSVSNNIPVFDISKPHTVEVITNEELDPSLTSTVPVLNDSVVEEAEEVVIEKKK